LANDCGFFSAMTRGSFAEVLRGPFPKWIRSDQQV
jgi:hypothetical protein